MKIVEKNFNGFSLRVVLGKNTEWFVVKDVCDVLEIAEPRDAVRNLRERFGKAGLDTKDVVTTHPLKTLVYQRGVGFIRKLIQEAA